jgi:hypothetical protein
MGVSIYVRSSTPRTARRRSALTSAPRLCPRFEGQSCPADTLIVPSTVQGTCSDGVFETLLRALNEMYQGDAGLRRLVELDSRLRG